MNLKKTIHTVAQEHVDGKTTPPNNFTISPDYMPKNTLQIAAFWKEWQENSFGLPNDEENTGMEMPRRYNIEITNNSHPELYTELRELLDAITNKISIKNSRTTIESLSIRTLLDDTDTPFYNTNYAPYGSMILIKTTMENTPSEQLQPILTHTKNQLTEFLDPEFTLNQLTELTGTYSDRNPCKLVNISGYVQTPNPYKYYSNVSSIDEYITTLADDSEEEEKLRGQDTYEVYFRLSDADENPSPEAQNLATTYMENIISQTTEINHEHKIEGESFYYDPITDEEETSYWLRLPIHTDDI